MTTDYWLQSAEQNDVLVVDLLLRIKHSSDSDSNPNPNPHPNSNSSPAPPPLTTITTSTTKISAVLPPRWGQRKNRSKSTAPTTAAVTDGGKQHRGSPTTHLSWSGGTGSTSDGSDESSRPLDLTSATRSVKAFVELKDEESYLLNERKHSNNKLTSTRAGRDQELARCANLKRTKIDLDENQRRKIHVSCRVEEEREGPKRGFVLPDLNVSVTEEDLQFV